MSRLGASARRVTLLAVALALALPAWAIAWERAGMAAGATAGTTSRASTVALSLVVVPSDPLRNGTALPVAFATKPHKALLVEITHGISITSKPGGGKPVGYMPAASPQFGFRTYAWVIKRSENGKYGRVPVPYSSRGGVGWIPLKGLHKLHTGITVRADLSRHLITVERLGKVIFRMKAATGASWSPTPTGRYFVTDRVPFYVGSSYGSFAFGISNYQYNLPAGWQGGSQLAIHGTNDPGSIGRSVSAGCLRVSEQSLALLEPLLRLGTPVIIQA